MKKIFIFTAFIFFCMTIILNLYAQPQVNSSAKQVSKYIQDLKYGTSGIRCESAETLGEMGSSARESMPVLIDAIKDYGIRNFVIEAMGKIGDPSALDALNYVVKYDKDPKIKKAAGEAIKRIKSKMSKGNFLRSETK